MSEIEKLLFKSGAGTLSGPIEHCITITHDAGYIATSDYAARELAKIDQLKIDNKLIHKTMEELGDEVRKYKAENEQLVQDGYRLTQKLAKAQVRDEEARKLILHFRSGGGYMPNLCEVCADANTWLAEEE